MDSKAGSGEGGTESELSRDNSFNRSGSKHRYRRSMSYGEDEKALLVFSGWVYHVGVNSIGHEYCHHRFLYIRGKYVEMYRRDPQENPGSKPIRKGIIGPTLMVEETGVRKVGNEEYYTIQFYSRLDETKKGEIACTTAEESKKWIEAFDYAKNQAEYELSRGGGARNKLSMEADIDLEGHRPRVRRYASGLKKLIRIGQGGPDMLSRQGSSLGNSGSFGDFEGEFGDAIEAHEWKCVRTINGVRILEDVSDSKSGKASLVKAVALVDASVDTVLEVILNTDRQRRYEWDMLTGDLELVDSYDGNYDVVYGTYDPKYLTRWQSKKDFVFSRQWFQGQDGAYTILQFPAVHKKRPPRNGYQRTTIKPSTWEVRSLNGPDGSNTEKCLVTHMLEIHNAGWGKWKKNNYSKFEKTIPKSELVSLLDRTFMLKAGWTYFVYLGSDRFYWTGLILSQPLLGLKEYIGANPSLKCESSSMGGHSKHPDGELPDEFYDAISGASSSTTEDEESDDEPEKEEKPVKEKHASSALSSSSLKQTLDATQDANKELDPSVPPIHVDASQFNGSLHKGKDDADTNCWTSPGGAGFMIRGKTYLKNSAKITGGEPLLKLIAVDWFKVDKATDKIALHPKSQVQSDAGKKLPFVLVINLELKPAEALLLKAERCLLGTYSFEIINVDDMKTKVVNFEQILLLSMVNEDHALTLNSLPVSTFLRRIPTLVIPAKPNYSLVLYYAADRPVNKDSLLEKFVEGTDAFRDARFKLIPSIVEGYWMVKRAVGTKACLLGKAVACKYFRQDNFWSFIDLLDEVFLIPTVAESSIMQIDVDIGSSSVARSVIGLVLGYVTSLVVDLAILMEANVEEELPEYILGSVRLNRVRLESAIPLDG
ncbi:leucine-rich repeat receptor-like protein kinase TDR-like [Hibiscus syriacus]|uniref:Leucine-rich repeat receptor-like protein kinase TDR-like n=1 Tax=Hibiscus syriacus TaxID=106335 RepID=A0A6A3BEU9_HIBSY|nr:leucine-rich repeat receptor-like protein kinase TDR-like [Hibiscus syriacus]